MSTDDDNSRHGDCCYLSTLLSVGSEIYKYAIHSHTTLPDHNWKNVDKGLVNARAHARKRNPYSCVWPPLAPPSSSYSHRLIYCWLIQFYFILDPLDSYVSLPVQWKRDPNAIHTNWCWNDCCLFCISFPHFCVLNWCQKKKQKKK